MTEEKVFTQEQKDRMEMFILAMIGERVVQIQGKNGLADLFDVSGGILDRIMDGIELDHTKAMIDAMVERIELPSSKWWKKFLEVYTGTEQTLDRQDGPVLKLRTELGLVEVEFQFGKKDFPEHVMSRVVEHLSFMDVKFFFKFNGNTGSSPDFNHDGYAEHIAGICRRQVVHRITSVPGITRFEYKTWTTPDHTKTNEVLRRIRIGSEPTGGFLTKSRDFWSRSRGREPRGSSRNRNTNWK